MALLQAALNGGRDHPALPRTPEELAAEGRAAVDAGARVLHLHPYDADGRQTLDAEPCAAAIRAVRAACPGIPISLSTSAEIEPDPERRRALVAAWTELPDLVTANQGEEAIVDLCALLLERGVGIEAGNLSPADAEAFAASGLASRCVRAMIEPLGADPAEAVAEAEAMEAAIAAVAPDARAGAPRRRNRLLGGEPPRRGARPRDQDRAGGHSGAARRKDRVGERRARGGRRGTVMGSDPLRVVEG